MGVQQPLHVQHDVMVPMRDGVRLATDIYFPVEDGRRGAERSPTVMERTPYDKEAPSRPDTARYFADRGYVVVFQDTRGRFGSEGSFVKYLDDPGDGYDTVEWTVLRDPEGDEFCVERAMSSDRPLFPTASV